MIYSPGVPWFRTRNRELLERCFLAAVITAPAPNAGEVLRRDPAAGPAIEAALRRRAGIVLAVARAQGHRTPAAGRVGLRRVSQQPAPWSPTPSGTGWSGRSSAAASSGSCSRSTNSSQEQATLRAFQERFPPQPDRLGLTLPAAPVHSAAASQAALDGALCCLPLRRGAQLSALSAARYLTSFCPAAPAARIDSSWHARSGWFQVCVEDR